MLNISKTNMFVLHSNTSHWDAGGIWIPLSSWVMVVTVELTFELCHLISLKVWGNLVIIWERALSSGLSGLCNWVDVCAKIGRNPLKVFLGCWVKGSGQAGRQAGSQPASQPHWHWAVHSNLRCHIMSLIVVWFDIVHESSPAILLAIIIIWWGRKRSWND